MELEDKSKLFVFEKKEVILIFFFMVVITVTAFTLGVKVGKGIFIDSVGITKPDIQKTIDLQSVEEEGANNLDEGTNLEDSLNKEDLTQQGLQDKLNSEFGNLVKEERPVDIDTSTTEPIEVTASPEAPEDLFIDGDANAGKFTIQLVSLETRAEAEKYAEPFVAANYTVVINEASVPNKGTWYRVGIGLFDTQEEAKNYLEQEKSLFRGKRYLINQIK
jgi:septal ring-binding cell division protein DamX